VIVAPAIYDVRITHTRRERRRRAFSHRSYLWLVDLDDLPTPRWRLGPRFEARDHLGNPGRTIRHNVDDWLAREGIDLAGGRVVMLCQARSMGYVFNPLSIFWCHGPTGALACVIAEVHNTYGERHCYLLRPPATELQRSGWLDAEVSKAFYVSPFFDVDGGYRIRISPPSESLSVSISLRRQGQVVFAASVRGRRHPAGALHLLRFAARLPMATYRTSALIRMHGLLLWMRRVPVVPRPRHEPQEGVQ
jgi:DUF1365 family protein